MARVELKALYYKTELLLSNPCVYLSHLILVDKQEENSIQTQPQPPHSIATPPSSTAQIERQLETLAPQYTPLALVHR